MKFNPMICFFGLCGFSLMALAGGGPFPGPITAPGFDRLRELEGTWVAKSTMGQPGNEPEEVHVNYKVTSGGSLVVETLFPGMRIEMVSVYHSTPEKMTMTHYCMRGHRPEMKLVKQDKNSMHFEIDESNAPSLNHEPHMRGVILSWKDDNHFTQQWIPVEKDTKNPPIVLDFKKKTSVK